MNERSSIAKPIMPRLASQAAAALCLNILWLMPASAQATQTVATPATTQAQVAPVVPAASSCSNSSNPDGRAFSPSLEVKQAAISILQLVSNLSLQQTNNNFVVNVPSYNFAGILQELQYRNAKFASSSTRAPASAKAVFTLQSDKAGLSQTVYLMQ